LGERALVSHALVKKLEEVGGDLLAFGGSLETCVICFLLF
jgi:hypothetical protein